MSNQIYVNLKDVLRVIDEELHNREEYWGHLGDTISGIIRKIQSLNDIVVLKEPEPNEDNSLKNELDIDKIIAGISTEVLSKERK